MIRYVRPERPAAFDETISGPGGFQKSRWDAFKEPGRAAQCQKCGYCEASLVGHYGDVDHFLPKGGVTTHMDAGTEGACGKARDRKTTGLLTPGYWWRAHQWRNYVVSCQVCNQSWKRNLVAAVPPHTAADPPCKTRSESNQLLNPYDDTPSRHLSVDSSGIMIGSTARGRATIAVLGLDVRVTLDDQRAQAYEQARAAIANALRVPSEMNIRQLQVQVADTASYCLARRQAVRDYVAGPLVASEVGSADALIAALRSSAD